MKSWMIFCRKPIELYLFGKRVEKNSQERKQFYKTKYVSDKLIIIFFDK
jgi:hypothetical protein